ncbi:basic proline-rich protein-like isoform X1 [Anguilla anguilla]|uniref:basic proline-rich protein-like isoform X1 n=1 Tax=Anguilla anguilla TaxID=7936 RepID=UPI0015AD5706|nr:basic proline-rich protein-like isoform X1 [Anguilla anguilla]
MDDLGPLDFPPAYPGPPINDYGGMAGPSQPGFQGSPYPPFQPGPYQGGPAPGGYPATPQYYAGQPGPQQMGPVPGGYPATPQYYPGQPGPQQMGPVPGGYPATPQYYPGQPGPQQIGPAPGGYEPSPPSATVQPQPHKVDQKNADNRRVDKKPADSNGGCKLCCLKTKKCLMSPECGRGLQIASVISMCGMCIRFFV